MRRQHLAMSRRRLYVLLLHKTIMLLVHKLQIWQHARMYRTKSLLHYKADLN